MQNGYTPEINAYIVQKKLRVKDGMSLLAINAPDYFKGLMQYELNVAIGDDLPKYDQIHWFVKDRAQMESNVSKIIQSLKGEMICWCFFPKKHSGIQTDLSRDEGWDELMKHDITWLTLISFDETWSTFSFRKTTEKDRKAAQKKAEAKPVEDFEIYIDLEKRIVNPPPDFAKVLKAHKVEERFFNSLSFTNKREYVEWIISAKQEVTRQNRIRGAVERLGDQWKNPSGR